MLRTTSNIQRGSGNLRKLSQNAKRAHSLVVGVDSLLSHVANNKAFNKSTRDKAVYGKGLSQAVIHVLSGDFVKSATKAVRPWTEKDNANPFDYKVLSRQIPTHVRESKVKKHEHPFFGNVGGDEDLYS